MEKLNFSKTKLIISTIPSNEANLLLLTQIKELNKKIKMIIVTANLQNTLDFYDYGASYVLVSHLLWAGYFSSLMGNNKISMKNFLSEKTKDLEHIAKKIKK